MAEIRKKRPRDPIALAKLIGDIATGQTEDRVEDRRNPAAFALDKLGGAKGGRARADKLTPERREKIAQKAGPMVEVKRALLIRSQEIPREVCHRPRETSSL